MHSDVALHPDGVFNLPWSIDPLSDKDNESEINLWKFNMNSALPTSLNPSAGVCLAGTTKVVCKATLQTWISVVCVQLRVFVNRQSPVRLKGNNVSPTKRKRTREGLFYR